MNLIMSVVVYALVPGKFALTSYFCIILLYILPPVNYEILATLFLHLFIILELKFACYLICLFFSILVL